MYSLKVHKKEYKKGPRRSIIKWVQQARTSVVISYAFLIACKCINYIMFLLYPTVFYCIQKFQKGKIVYGRGRRYRTPNKPSPDK